MTLQADRLALLRAAPYGRKRGVTRRAIYTLGEVATHTDVVEMACDSCGRQEQYRASDLVRRFGGDVSIPELLQTLSSDCPRRQNEYEPGSEPCDAYCPSLPRQLLGR